MLNELMGEVNKEKKKQISGQQIKADVPAQQQKQTNKSKVKVEEDDIAKMLADLG